MDDETPLRLIQISDIHLFADPNRVLLGVKTRESFQALVARLKNEMDKINLVMLSGDLSQDGSEVSYVVIADVFKLFRVPIYWVPGNHDNYGVMMQMYPREMMANQKHIILKNWHIILLNSQKPGAVEGYLDASQLEHLKHCLQTYPEHYAIIMFHHQPVPVGCSWLDQLGLTNAEEFWNLVTTYPKVKAVFFGHVHQEFSQIMRGIACYAVPSTCIQFKPNQDHFGLEKKPPAYRWIELYKDGYLETGIERIKEYVGVFDVNAKGY